MERYVQLYHHVWQAVQDRFFDRDKLANWAEWEHKFDDQLNSIEDATAAINEMLTSLNDEFTRFVPPSNMQFEREQQTGEMAGTGAIVVRVPDSPLSVQGIIPGSAAEGSCICPGDEIVAIDEVPATDLSARDACMLIRGPVGSMVTLWLQRGNQRFSCSLERRAYNETVVVAKHLPGNIGYVYIRHFLHSQVIDQLREALSQTLKGCAGLIIDIRVNGGGNIDVANRCLGMLIPDGRLVRIETRTQSGAPRYCTWLLTPEVLGKVPSDAAGALKMPLKPTGDVSASRRDSFLLDCRIPIVLLVDRTTGSAAELAAGALKDNERGLLVGDDTFGKGIGQAGSETPEGGFLWVTNLRYLTPKGSWPGDAQSRRFGISPHIRVQAGSPNCLAGSPQDNQLWEGHRIMTEMITTSSAIEHSYQ